MKPAHKITMKFEKGELYHPDSLNNFPRELYSHYFENSDDYGKGSVDYEWGSDKCKKSCKLEITIHDL